MAALIQSIKYRVATEVLPAGSMHKLQRADYTNHLAGKLLDRSEASATQELEVINNLPLTYDTILGHFRNLPALVSRGCRVVYISFERAHKSTILLRYTTKCLAQFVSEHEYNLFAGVSWPTYLEYCNGQAIPELTNFHMGSCVFDDWEYILPNNHDAVCEIKFNEILSGYGLIHKLASFLNITNFDIQQAYAILDEYRAKQLS